MRTVFSGFKFLSLIAKNKKFIVEQMNKFETDIKTDLETERKTDILSDRLTERHTDRQTERTEESDNYKAVDNLALKMKTKIAPNTSIKDRLMASEANLLADVIQTHGREFFANKFALDKKKKHDNSQSLDCLISECEF